MPLRDLLINVESVLETDILALLKGKNVHLPSSLNLFNDLFFHVCGALLQFTFMDYC